MADESLIDRLVEAAKEFPSVRRFRMSDEDMRERMREVLEGGAGCRNRTGVISLEG